MAAAGGARSDHGTDSGLAQRSPLSSPSRQCHAMLMLQTGLRENITGPAGSWAWGAAPDGIEMPSLGFYTIGITALLAGPAVGVGTAPAIEVLASVRAVPPDVAAGLAEPAGFVQVAVGQYVVFDRRGHTLLSLTPDWSVAQPIVQIGFEPGRLLQPFGFDVDPDGRLVVGDAPQGVERIQVFTGSGSRVAGFSLPRRPGPRLDVDGVVLNGISSLRASARQTVLVNQPNTGALVTEYDYDGTPLRSFGILRATGHESDSQLHWALNRGIALAVPGGGFIFLFQTGEPRFRRYDASGRLLFERVIQGPELDDWLQKQPDVWAARGARDAGTLPLVSLAVRAAAVDRAGDLWVSLAVPYTYVFDARGEKRRTVQFKGAGIIAPRSLAFTSDRRLLVTPGCYEFAP